jgi:hypothetical protein
VPYFVGDSVSTLDIYWTAFANLLDPLRKSSVLWPRPGVRVLSSPVRSSGRRLIRCCWNTVHECFASTSAVRWSSSEWIGSYSFGPPSSLQVEEQCIRD